MPGNDDTLPSRSTASDVQAFLAKAAATPPVRARDGRGRLLFAMDATASREPTWDRACAIQARMFEETAAIGGLNVQLCWYRGHREFRTSPWVADPEALLARMSAVRCAAGMTQIGRVLRHAAEEAGRARVGALVFVGDCMEEDIDALAGEAGRLGLLGVPAFMFHEGDEPGAERAFREVARLTGGACCRFDAGSASQLRELLGAVAVYAAGGHRALEALGRRRGGAALALTHQLRRR